MCWKIFSEPISKNLFIISREKNSKVYIGMKKFFGLISKNRFIISREKNLKVYNASKIFFGIDFKEPLYN
jgi:hypothetical protein